ncbi:hypothetical protein GH714_011104 [Hevea brasiliensis]|uniref:Uncharacterized protein n=1 Tax=Hevea brasiliensis TaxID=3981 RepID=A0A6A6KF53_HEVBR|nr:hypothetical protein GH714_011104 [Hevea brasiliensis]
MVNGRMEEMMRKLLDTLGKQQTEEDRGTKRPLDVEGKSNEEYPYDERNSLRKKAAKEKDKMNEMADEHNFSRGYVNHELKYFNQVPQNKGPMFKLQGDPLSKKFKRDLYCEFHQIPGYDTNKCSRLRHEIQDLIDNVKIPDPEARIF